MHINEETNITGHNEKSDIYLIFFDTFNIFFIKRKELVKIQAAILVLEF